MTRLILVCVAVMFAGRVAHAQAFPNGADLVFNKVYFQDQDDGEYREPVDDDDAYFYLNYAHCECARKGLGNQQKIAYDITLLNNMSTMTNEPAEVWVGTGCDNETTRPLQCTKTAASIPNVDQIPSAGQARIELSLFQVFFPLATDPMMASCAPGGTGIEQSAKVWLIADAMGNDGTLDYFKSTDVPTTDTSAMTAIVKAVDTKAPEVPPNLKVESGEESIVISWDTPSNPDSIYVFQALCIDPEGLNPAEVDAKYQTQFDVCGEDSGITLGELDQGGDGTLISETPAPFIALDTNFVCGEASKTAPNLTIKELDNGKAYQVALLAVDRYGNVAGTRFMRTVTPQPVTDLWEDLHDRNSAVDGGCLLSQTYGDGNPLTRVLRDFRDTTLARTGYGRGLTHAYYATLGKLTVEGSIVLRVIAGLLLAPFVVVALLWHALTLPGLLALIALLAFRRRLKRYALAVLLLAPSLASADDFEPYWATSEQEDASLLTIPEVDWHVGIKVGPYIPEIDLQAGLNAATGMGPYEAMFGDYYTLNSDGVTVKKHEQRVWQVLPMLDVDRVLWEGFGQFTVGGSIGYMQKSAYAYVAGTSPDDEMRPRSTSGKNTFRLIPAAATVGYRFTYLDDAYGIPVVPYVRGGLSYYVWWMKAPNGNLSKICDADSPEGMCNNENKAYGGSFGFQGSIGLSIRAERIDANAATSMRTSGLMHAGFYAELSYAKVDGFGSDSKLSVGDNTWFAGVDFEF
jgi:hypothetical protein